MLLFAEYVTYKFQKQTHQWTLSEQINETFTEVAELNQFIRHNRDRPLKEVKKELIEEIWDIVFSAITTSHILGIQREEMREGFDKVISKLRKRIEEQYYKNLSGCVQGNGEKTA